jgi:hypothetical protein
MARVMKAGTARKKSRYFGLCIKNRGYPVSLETRKIYEMLADPWAATRGLVRVIDESGEDYLYPETYFVPIELPPGAARYFVPSIPA